MNYLLILAADAKKYQTIIKAANLQNLEIRVARDLASARGLIDGCNIILGEPSLVSKVLAFTGPLHWVQSTWAGVDRLCAPGLRRDYVLTGVKDVFGPLISEYVMTYLFALERQVFSMRTNQSNRNWQALPYRPARDIKLGIVGLGSIGRHLAHTARFFGLQVTGLNRSGRSCDDVERVYTAKHLAGFLNELDYVVLTLPDTPGTRQLFDAGVFRLMKPSAVLMNVGRGSIVNEEDLAAALHDGIIGAAVLDVFANEPLPVDSPLWQMPGVYVTPHNAATSFTEDIVGVFVSNYQRFLHNKDLKYVIDFDLGY